MTLTLLLAAFAVAPAPGSCPPISVARAALAPHSADQLMQRYREAHDRKDIAAMGALFCFDPDAPQMPVGTANLTRGDFSRAIVHIAVLPIKPGQKFEYVQGGVTYRPTLSPIGWLKIDFKPATEHADASTSMLVGVSGGVYYLLSAAAVKK